MASNQGRHRRVLKELEDIRRNPPLNCSAGPISDSDIFNWRATIMGLKPPFDGGIFSLNLEIPDKYPFEAPKIKFTTPIFHPNVKEDGYICLEILTNPDKWSPTISLSKVLSSIRALLDEPDTSHSLRPEVAKMYDEQREKFMEQAREHTQKYAT